MTDETTKRRGRPPKLIKAGPGVISPAGYVADGDYYRLAPPKAALLSQPGEVQATEPTPEPVAAVLTSYAAKDYALRIWNGQSPDLPRKERIARVKAGLEAQGMTIDGVELPNA